MKVQTTKTSFPKIKNSFNLEDKQEKQPEVEAVAEEPKEEKTEPKEETTDEAAGFQGQTEARQFDIRLSGDFDRDRPTSDNDAAAVKNVLKNAGIEAEVQPSEADFSSVSINTMSQPEAVMNALGDMVDESLEYKDELSENKKQFQSRRQTTKIE